MGHADIQKNEIRASRLTNQFAGGPAVSGHGYFFRRLELFQERPRKEISGFVVVNDEDFIEWSHTAVEEVISWFSVRIWIPLALSWIEHRRSPSWRREYLPARGWKLRLPALERIFSLRRA